MMKTSRLELLGETEHDGDTILSSDDERTALEDAVEFLRDHLADGARHSAKEIFREAAALHIGDRTLQRARKKLCAKTEKSGFGVGWEWWLPAAKAPASSNPVALSPSSPSVPTEEHEEHKGDRDLVLGTFDGQADDDIPF